MFESKNSFYKKTQRLNGMGVTAIEFVTILQELTGRNDLNKLTLLSLKEIIPQVGLLKQYRSWCPHCLEDMRVAEDTIYEPLIWILQSVTVCPLHKTKLLSFCPRCNKQLWQITYFQRPGYCSNCHSWLGGRTGNKLDEDSVDLQIAKKVAELIEKMGCKEFVSFPDGVAVSLNTLINCSFQGNIASAARALGVSKSVLWGWSKGQNKPILPKILNMCVLWKLDINDFLNGTVKKVEHINVKLPDMTSLRQNRIS